MLIQHEQVFDEFIKGTTTTWYTGAQHDALFGAGDTLAAFAAVSAVTVASGSLVANVYFDESCDDQHWSLGSTALVAVTANAGDMLAKIGTSSRAPALPYGRLRVVMTGSTPACRLKLYVTVRGF